MKGKVAFLIITSSVGSEHVRMGSMTQHLVGVRSINLEVDLKNPKESAEQIFEKFFNKKHLVMYLRELRVFHLAYSSEMGYCEVRDGDQFVKEVEEILLKKITKFKKSFEF